MAAYSTVLAEVIAGGVRIFWYAGPDAAKPTSGLTIGSIYTTTDNGKLYVASSSTAWTEKT